jgi:hypothetical protein
MQLRDQYAWYTVCRLLAMWTAEVVAGAARRGSSGCDVGGPLCLFDASDSSGGRRRVAHVVVILVAT